MRKKIKISKPYIRECKSKIFGDAVRLCADITMLNPNTNKEETKECYFEFEKGYKKYLCPERSDAFVTGLLSSAMELDMDIEFEMPISERLYYQLINYYIPIVSKSNSYYPLYNINLFGPYNDTQIKNEKAVATGCSGGVDSFYTIVKHTNDTITSTHRLTHLVCSSSGTSDNDKERILNTFSTTLSDVTKIAKDCNLKAIGCFNNLNEFYVFPYKAFNMFYTTTFSSVCFALQKLISIYYVNAGDPISKFALDLSTLPHGYDSSIFDIFTVSCINTENLSFYSTGVECVRIEREKFISDFKPAHKNLMVCNSTPFFDKPNKFRNCSLCYKDLRTMVDFYAMRKLDNFNEVFDVDNFKRNKVKLIGKMIALNKKAYVQEMKEEAKKNNVKLPLFSYFFAYFWYKPIRCLRNKFSKSLLARKIYYKFNIDYKLDGYRGPAYEIYNKKIKRNK